jgi:two-component system, OmpR family, sensor kinase
MIFRSIKWSLQLWHGVILLVVLAGFGYTAFELQRTREMRRVDEELQERVARVFGPMRAPGPGPGSRPARPAGSPERRRSAESRRDLPDELPPVLDRSFLDSYDGPVYHIIWRRDGRIVRAEDAPEDLVRPSTSERPGIRTRDHFRELVRITPRGDTILVGRSIEAELSELRRLALILVGSGAGILVLGLAGGWMAANRAMRPIENISSTALKISSGDLSQRIEQEETESELGRLVSVLNSTFARLESAFSEQTRFTTDVSHELRTPVAVIVSQTQSALARERPAAEYRQTIEACQRAAQRMRGLIESLLQLARLDAGQEPFRRDAVDLAQIARESVELLAPLAQEHAVRVSTQLSEASCLGDAGRLGQVAVNLITNAIRYTPKGGTVTVLTGRGDGDLVFLTVADTGIGIPADDLPHIFDRFYRVEQSRSREKGGSGLGLAISQAIISAHSGTIEASSEPGRGSRFTVRLPGGK